ncbi:MAG: hypothetical protein GKS05_04460 [Nitrospirales bacterium]|nr:hypothetical protein [Nitrospirales bacterium]
MRVCLLLGVSCALLVSCNQISIPRLTFEEEPTTYLPISVAYDFDPQLNQASLEVDACGFSYTIPTGDIIRQAFLDVSQDRFASVTTHQAGQPSTASASTNVVIQVSLANQVFDAINRSGEEDRYNATIDLELLAIFIDAQGNHVAKAPLVYHDTTRMWVPELSSQSSSCSTGQFDQEFYDAAEILAKDLSDRMPQLFGQPPTPGTVAQNPVLPQTTFPPVPQAVASASALSFRTLLQDGNDNLVLEGGEKLILQIEVTNKGIVPIASALVELSGTQIILKAFSQVTEGPVTMGVLQPGETKMTEVRGLMPSLSEKARGELIVSVRTPDGISAGTHRILAAIQPSKRAVLLEDLQREHTSRPAVLPAQPQEDVPLEADDSDSPYYAILIGLGEYRDSWIGKQQIVNEPIQALRDALQSTGIFVSDHIRTLENAHATKTDIEEALFSWAMPRMTKESVLVLYYAGHTLIDHKTGEVYVVPYEGSPRASKSRLISLKTLQRVLGKLDVRLALLFLDAPLTNSFSRLREGKKSGIPSPKWHDALAQTDDQEAATVIQIRRTTQQPLHDPAKLLSGLLGRADRNQDGGITVGEMIQDLESVAEVVPPMARLNTSAEIPLAQ